jgi:hypothetical protein
MIKPGRWRAIMAVGFLAMLLTRSHEAPRAAPQPTVALAPAPCDPADAPHGVTAFPGAEGFGRFARGGRGGAVYPVTSLADAGPGTLRACAEAAGARTCIFRVSGTIAVDRWIEILQPFLTIAGETSPGGIAIRIRDGRDAPMLIQTHDVIIRHVRLRPGPSSIPSTNVDTIQISGGAHDVILDHVSTSWPTDEGINIVGHGEKPATCGETRNITVQWSILSEGLDRSNRGAHSRGTYFGYGAGPVSLLHSLIASNMRRNPLSNMRGQFDMINNILFNSGRYNAEYYTRFGDLAVNMIGNAAIVGPSSDKSTQLYLADYFRDYPATFRIHAKGNLDVHRRTDRGDERLVLEPNDWRYFQSTPVGPLSVPASAISGPAEAYRTVLMAAGATRPVRDAADTRLLRDMMVCRGAIIDDPARVGGWPVLGGPPAPPDRDDDGMPDAWEVAHGLSPDDPADRNGDPGGTGRTHLERYLAERAGDGRDPALPVAAGVTPDPSCGFPIAVAPPLPDVHLTATPARIVRGGRSELRWRGTDLRACKLDDRGVPPDGRILATPVKTRTYLIACIGTAGGDSIDSVVVTVDPPGG